MQSVVRSFMSIFLALGAVVVMSAWWVTATAIPLLAAHTTALIMGGTFHPLTGPRDKPDFVTSYLDNAVIGHLDAAFAGPVTNAVAVFTPEEFFPIGRLTLDRSVAEGRANLHRCLAATADCVYNDDAAVTPGVGSVAPQPGDLFQVFGYSQSSVIASLLKRDLIADYSAGDAVMPFMLVANPMRPNGGVLMRGAGLPTIPILGITFTGASPTDSVMLPDGNYAYPTVDIARQYDGLGGDFPVRPLNLVATLNALLGYGLLHGETVDVPFGEARYQGREGDTSYYLIETDIVPLLQPFAFFIPKAILKAIDAPLRVIIEDAYDRGINPGVPTAAGWWPTNDLFGLIADVIRAIPVAVDNLFEGFGLPRVLRTEAPGTFGVAGPELPADPAAVTAQSHRTVLTSDGTGSEDGQLEVDSMTGSIGVSEKRGEVTDTGSEEPAAVAESDPEESSPEAEPDVSAETEPEAEPEPTPEPTPEPDPEPDEAAGTDTDASTTTDPADGDSQPSDNNAAAA